MIKKSNSAEFFHYQGASYLVLLKIFKDIIKETPGFDFVDIGCGKGRAVFAAEFCGYNSLYGIELDKELVEEAQNNLKLYPFKRKESSIAFMHENALDYEYKDKPTVYFLFNPFSEDIMRKVLNRIDSSTNSQTWFVYMNPLYMLPFIEKKAETIRVYKTWMYKEAVIFKFKKRD